MNANLTNNEVNAVIETYEGLIRQLPADGLYTPRARDLFARLNFWKAKLSCV